MLPYELTASAQEDLKAIARYTITTWGNQQALKYAALLETHFGEIANGSAFWAVFFEAISANLGEPLRASLCFLCSSQSQACSDHRSVTREYGSGEPAKGPTWLAQAQSIICKWLPPN
jgi:hypothetical protein